MPLVSIPCRNSVRTPLISNSVIVMSTINYTSLKPSLATSVMRFTFTSYRLAELIRVAPFLCRHETSSREVHGQDAMREQPQQPAQPNQQDHHGHHKLNQTETTKRTFHARVDIFGRTLHCHPHAPPVIRKWNPLILPVA